MFARRMFEAWLASLQGLGLGSFFIKGSNNSSVNILSNSRSEQARPASSCSRLSTLFYNGIKTTSRYLHAGVLPKLGLSVNRPNCVSNNKREQILCYHFSLARANKGLESDREPLPAGETEQKKNNVKYYSCRLRNGW